MRYYTPIRITPKATLAWVKLKGVNAMPRIPHYGLAVPKKHHSILSFPMKGNVLGCIQYCETPEEYL